MLNVAVSRAQKSFLFFGCISAFDNGRNEYSTKLVELLLANPENEICNIKPTLIPKETENRIKE